MSLVSNRRKSKSSGTKSILPPNAHWTLEMLDSPFAF